MIRKREKRDTRARDKVTKKCARVCIRMRKIEKVREKLEWFPYGGNILAQKC